MKLEDHQVCSLEPAKKLKELNVKQESLFYWDVLGETAYGVRFAPYSCPGLERYSAFTVAELIEILPAYINDWDLIIKKCPSEYEIKYCSTEAKILKITWDKNLANGLTGMLIYLIENKLMVFKNDMD